MRNRLPLIVLLILCLTLLTLNVVFSNENIQENSIPGQSEESAEVSEEAIAEETEIEEIEEVEAVSIGEEVEAVEEAVEEESIASGEASGIADILDRLDFSLKMQTIGLYVNNADLRTLDNSYWYTREQTDDRSFWAVGGLSLSFGYQVNDNLKLNASISGNGFLSNDQMSKATLSIKTLNFEAMIPLGTFGDLTFKIGRLFYSIGGSQKIHDEVSDLEDVEDKYIFNYEYEIDYFFADVVDAVIVELGMGKAGKISAMWDFYGLRSPLAETPYRYVDMLNSLKYDSDGEEMVGYNGDVQTFRVGIIYNNEFAEKFDLRIFGFFGRYGASDYTGAEISGEYDLNQSDNDFTSMFGARFTANLIQRKTKSDAFGLSFWVDVAGSAGIDRKSRIYNSGTPDVTTLGIAGSAGVVAKVSVLRIMADAFYSMGGSYDEDGVQTNHGFVSFKGAQNGGLVMNMIYGMHPSAYLDTEGIRDTAQDMNRIAGTFIAHAGLTINPIKKLVIAVDWWLALDTNSTGITDFTNPYMQLTKQGQRRFGNLMGNEIDLLVSYKPVGEWELFAVAGVYIPGSFHSIQGVDSHSIGAPAPFYTAGNYAVALSIYAGTRIKI